MTKSLRPIPYDWTEARVEALKQLWTDGHTASQICRLLPEGASRNAVLGKAHRLGLMLRKRPALLQTKPRPRDIEPVRGKRVTLPPLPINGPAPTADTPLLKSDAWAPLPVSVPKHMADLGDIGRSDRLGDCRWPVGENPTLFCACATYGVYCPTHAAMAKPTRIAA